MLAPGNSDAARKGRAQAEKAPDMGMENLTLHESCRREGFVR